MMKIAMAQLNIQAGQIDVNLKHMHQMVLDAIEDKAYIMFKRYESQSWLTEQKEKGGLTKLISHIPNGFKWLVFDKIGLYATSPGRVLLSVVIFWFVFGLLYFL
ncbi:MAG: hypothetical protein HGA35_01115, partial [Erysipelotrichaceae bacterium]|nr:hypothetical protein [Erysipelotrichaceae bacterium]